jgi:phosphoribosylformylglycinamidine synthase
MIKKCNDFGAGGVSVAIGELCPGVDIDLSAIPTKYLGLDATALAISESQERMAVVVAKADVARLINYAKNENLEATVVAKVTDTNHLRMFFKKKRVVNIDRNFLNTNGTKQFTKVQIDKIHQSKLDISNKTCTQL